LALFALHQLDHVRVRVHHDRVPGEARFFAADRAEDLVDDGALRADLSRAVAVVAGLVEEPPEALARALPRHFDEPELRDAIERRLRLVLLEQIFETAAHLLSRARSIHVDEVENDETAEISEAELVGDLFDRFEVRLEDRLFVILRALADVAAGVD